MFIEIAYGLLGLCLSSACHLYDFFLSKIGKVVDETQNHPSFDIRCQCYLASDQ